MKFFTKLSIVFLLTAVSLSAHAQTIRVKAGGNLSSILMKDVDGRLTDKVKLHPGFHLGATVEIPIIDNFSFEPGLIFTTKGMTHEWFDITNKINLTYFDIPLTGRANFDIGDYKAFGLFGPYIGIGLTGKSKFPGAPQGGWYDYSASKIEWGAGTSRDFKRLEGGLTFGGGIELSPLEIGLSFNVGLSNMSPYTGNGQTYSNRVFNITVAYKIDR